MQAELREKIITFLSTIKSPHNRYNFFKLLNYHGKVLLDNSLKIKQIFSASNVKYGLSPFTDREIEIVERLIIELYGKFYIKCRIKDKYKITKPDEIVKQLWVYKLLNEYNYPKEGIDVERVVYFGPYPYIIFEGKRRKNDDK